MTAPLDALFARLRACGVRLVVREGRLRAVPSGRLGGALAAEVRANAQAVAATLAVDDGCYLTSAAEAAVCRAAEATLTLYRRAAATRARAGTGYRGAVDRDAAFFRAIAKRER